jgi:hypothetical protein
MKLHVNVPESEWYGKLEVDKLSQGFSPGFSYETFCKNPSMGIPLVSVCLK